MESEQLLFAGCIAKSRVEECRLCLQGLPCDSQSSYRRGSAEAPEVIRRVFNGDCYNPSSDSGVDLTESVADLGDLAPGTDWRGTMSAYAARGRDLFKSGRTPFFLGGDHAVTIPVVSALAVLEQPVHVLQLDAHADLYPEFAGDRFSHACTASRILEMPHIASLTILGVRTMNPVQLRAARTWSDRLRLEEACRLKGSIPRPAHLPEGALVYVTLDLDAFEPAFAPGVAHPVPGGLTPRQVLDFLADPHFRLAGMDAVEVNPSLDVNHQTAILAGRLVQQGMGLALSGCA